MEDIETIEKILNDIETIKGYIQLVLIEISKPFWVNQIIKRKYKILGKIKIIFENLSTIIDLYKNQLLNKTQLSKRLARNAYNQIHYYLPQTINTIITALKNDNISIKLELIEIFNIIDDLEYDFNDYTEKKEMEIKYQNMGKKQIEIVKEKENKIFIKNTIENIREDMKTILNFKYNKINRFGHIKNNISYDIKKKFKELQISIDLYMEEYFDKLNINVIYLIIKDLNKYIQKIIKSLNIYNFHNVSMNLQYIEGILGSLHSEIRYYVKSEEKILIEKINTENEKNKKILQKYLTYYDNSNENEKDNIKLNLSINIFFYGTNPYTLEQTLVSNKPLNVILPMHINKNKPIIYIFNYIQNRFNEYLKEAKIDSFIFHYEFYSNNNLIEFIKNNIFLQLELIKNINLDNNTLIVNLKIIQKNNI